MTAILDNRTAASVVVADTSAATERLCELAAHLNAGQAELAVLAADVDDAGSWFGAGYSTCAHWLSVSVGLSRHSALELLRVGHALRDLPRLRAAAATGALSLDKLRFVTRVTSSGDEDIWLEVALSASGGQLARICQAYARAGRDDSPDQAAERRARRGVWALWEDDGTCELRAILAAEDAAVVLAALDVVVARDQGERAGATAERPHPVEEPRAAARADALVSLCESVGTSHPTRGADSEHRLVVHIDLDTLCGIEGDGRCHIEDGVALPASVARRLGCDTELVAVSERDGMPHDVGRARRVVCGRLRRALHLRDRFCRYPGCAVPASRTHSHHIVHWANHGRTDLDNLLSLCGFHHRRLHDGAYEVTRSSDGEYRFTTASGKPILPPTAAVVDEPGTGDLRSVRAETREITAQSPRAHDAGHRIDFGYAISVLLDACAFRRQAAAGSSSDSRSPTTSEEDGGDRAELGSRAP